MKNFQKKKYLLFNKTIRNTFLVLSVISLFYQCRSIEKVIPQAENQNRVVKEVDIEVEPETIIRSEKEISNMIQELLVKTGDLWKESLPTYFGEDSRNHQTMIIIKYCSEKECDLKSYSLFLIYKRVNYKKCIEIRAQPLINPKTNEFIGCEPAS